MVEAILRMNAEFQGKMSTTAGHANAVGHVGTKILIAQSRSSPRTVHPLAGNSTFHSPRFASLTLQALV